MEGAKRSRMNPLSRLFLTLLCAGLVSGPALVPARSQAIVEDLVNVRFQPDPRIFAVMAALNAAGFDVDADALEQNPTRRLVREHLAAVPAELRTRLRDFYLKASSGTDPKVRQSPFVSYALLLNGPPSFNLPFREDEVPEDARGAFGFEKLVAELWKQAGLAA